MSDVVAPVVPSLSALDREMETVLRELALCSQVSAASAVIGGAGSDEPLGGSRPPGDLGAEGYARRYGPPFHACTTRCEHLGPARDDDGRRHVLKEAKAELRQSRGAKLTQIARPAGETSKDLTKRIVKEGEGYTVREAAVHFRCGESLVARARRDAGREVEFGKPPEPEGDPIARRARVRQLKDSGHGIAQISRILGVHRSTVERDLGQRAA